MHWPHEKTAPGRGCIAEVRTDLSEHEEGLCRDTSNWLPPFAVGMQKADIKLNLSETPAVAPAS